jgi:hypothetical protein
MHSGSEHACYQLGRDARRRWNALQFRFDIMGPTERRERGRHLCRLPRPPFDWDPARRLWLEGFRAD